MTISLVIDTATSRTIVGVVDNGVVVFEEFHEGATDHGAAISNLVARALKSTKLIDQIVIGMGPGPFTGLRVGITFAQSFALARSIPWIGVCSLDAIRIDSTTKNIQIVSSQDSNQQTKSETINFDDYTVAIDARRKQMYWARYKNGVRVLGPSVDKPEDIATYVTNVYPDIDKLVALSAMQNVREPIYLRSPDAIPTAQRT
jgi:tRNA threonylcarbamoyl adenosine modification protein YeaZ